MVTTATRAERSADDPLRATFSSLPTRFDSDYTTTDTPCGPFDSDRRTMIALRATIDPLR